MISNSRNADESNYIITFFLSKGKERRKGGKDEEMEFETQKLQVFKNPDTFVSHTSKNVNCYNSYREIWQCISKLLKYLYL